MDPVENPVHPLQHSLSQNEVKSTNVLVLYTGGTIGMHYTPTGLKPRSYMAAYLKKLPMLHDSSYTSSPHRKKPDTSAAGNVEELVMPLSEYGVRIFYYIKEYELKKDSSNMDMKDWVDIALDIKNNYDQFDSFIILHGTDTMSYTASALSFMFQNLDKTVVLTGSQIPIFEQRNDGRDNLLGALMIAGHFVIPEVTLFFQDKLYRGNRTTKINSGDFQAFDSPNLPALAKLKVKIQVYWDAIFRGNSSEQFGLHTELNRNVGVLRLFPGITVATVESMLRAPMQGIVLETFGAGNCPNDRTLLIQVIKDALDRGVIIVNCTQCLKGAVMKEYEAGKMLVDIGVLSGSDMTPEAALTKLSYTLARDDLSLEQKKLMMQTNLRGEMTVAVVESQFSLKDSKFIRAVSSTLGASSVKEMHYIRQAVHPLLLCSAAQSGELDIVDELCEQGNVNCCLEYDERTPLHIACANGNLDMVKKLLEHGASLYKVDKYGATPLLYAVQFKKDDVIRLLRQSGASIAPLSLGMAAEICVAAASNDVTGLEAWYLAGVDFNCVHNASGRTPLHEAVCSLSKHAVEYLLSRGINTATEDNLGTSALQNGLQLEKKLCAKDGAKNDERAQLIRDILSALNNCEVLRNSPTQDKV